MQKNKVSQVLSLYQRSQDEYLLLVALSTRQLYRLPLFISNSYREMNAKIIEKLIASYEKKNHWTFDEYLDWEQNLIQKEFRFLFIHRFFFIKILDKRYFSLSFHKKTSRILMAKKMLTDLNANDAIRVLGVR